MKRILLVDDSSGILDVLRFAFELAGFQVEVATSGRTAVDRAGEDDPDLIVTDLDLGDIDPRELLQRLRRRRAGGQARPVIVTTGMEPQGAAAIVEPEGVPLLQKPVDVWDLVSRAKRELMPS